MNNKKLAAVIVWDVVSWTVIVRWCQRLVRGELND